MYKDQEAEHKLGYCFSGEKMHSEWEKRNKEITFSTWFWLPTDAMEYYPAIKRNDIPIHATNRWTLKIR